MKKPANIDSWWIMLIRVNLNSHESFHKQQYQIWHWVKQSTHGMNEKFDVHKNKTRETWIKCNALEVTGKGGILASQYLLVFRPPGLKIKINMKLGDVGITGARVCPLHIILSKRVHSLARICTIVVVFNVRRTQLQTGMVLGPWVWWDVTWSWQGRGSAPFWIILHPIFTCSQKLPKESPIHSLSGWDILQWVGCLPQ